MRYAAMVERFGISRAWRMRFDVRSIQRGGSRDADWWYEVPHDMWSGRTVVYDNSNDWTYTDIWRLEPGMSDRDDPTYG